MEQKTAVVTGASSGIGRALAVRLLAEGWKVLLVGRARRALEALGGGEIYEADLADRADTGRALAAIALSHHRIDAVFANAGVLLPTLVFSPQGREMHFEVHVAAVHQMLQVLGPGLREARGVLVASGSSIRRMVRGLTVEELVRPRTFVPLTGPYAASKYALAAYLAEAAPGWEAQGVRLRAVDLPPTVTAMTRALPPWFRWARFAFARPEDAAGKLLQAAVGGRPPEAPLVPGLTDLLHQPQSLADGRRIG